MKRNDKINIKLFEPGRIELDINPSDKASFILFISDNFYPGWKAEIDGKKADIINANYTFKAIKIDNSKGKNNINVKLNFMPDRYCIVFFISFFTMLICLLLYIILKIKEFRCC